MSRLTPQTPLEKLTGKLKPQPWGNAQAAVAILVKPKKDDLEFFLVKRAEVDDDPWSGDMAFPGGKKNLQDETLIDTAVREVLEETSIDLRDKKVIVRLHSFEAIDTPYPLQVAWPNVDHLVLVCEDILSVLRMRQPDLERQVDVRIIPNGIDCARFANNVPPSMTDIAWVGTLEMKKNPGLLLQIMARLVQIDPTYHAHVAGRFTDLRMQRYLQHIAGRMKLESNVTFHGHVADMPQWLQDKGILLSTTLYESFGMNIGEGMAAGACPVVHDFPGAAAIWPPECLFSTVGAAVDRIQNALPGGYVQEVREKYDLPVQLAPIDALLTSPNMKRADDSNVPRDNTSRPPSTQPGQQGRDRRQRLKRRQRKFSVA